MKNEVFGPEKTQKTWEVSLRFKEVADRFVLYLSKGINLKQWVESYLEGDFCLNVKNSNNSNYAIIIQHSISIRIYSISTLHKTEIFI